MLFSSFGKFFGKVRLPSGCRVVHSCDTEHAGIPFSGLAFSVLWLVPPPEWEYCILSPSFSVHGLHAGACTAPDQGVQNLLQKRMISCVKLLAWLCAAFLLCHFFHQVRTSLSPWVLICPRTHVLHTSPSAEAEGCEPGIAASPALCVGMGDRLILWHCTASSVLDACPGQDGKPLK